MSQFSCATSTGKYDFKQSARRSTGIRHTRTRNEDEGRRCKHAHDWLCHAVVSTHESKQGRSRSNQLQCEHQMSPYIMPYFLLTRRAGVRSHSGSNFSQLARRQIDICRCRTGRAPLFHLRRCRFARKSKSSSVTPVFLPGQRRSPACCGNNAHLSVWTNCLHVHFQPCFKRLLISCSRFAFILTSSASASTQRRQISVSPLCL